MIVMEIVVAGKGCQIPGAIKLFNPVDLFACHTQQNVG
jgi:hypothetical protein